MVAPQGRRTFSLAGQREALLVLFLAYVVGDPLDVPQAVVAEAGAAYAHQPARLEQPP